MSEELATITADDALAALAEVVNEAGIDYIYKPPRELGGCVYVYDGQPSCGVGRALAKLGFSVEEIAALDTMSASTGGPSPIQAMTAYRAFPSLSYGACQVFSVFQRRQDQQDPWSKALAVATLMWRKLRKENDAQ